MLLDLDDCLDPLSSTNQSARLDPLLPVVRYSNRRSLLVAADSKARIA